MGGYIGRMEKKMEPTKGYVKAAAETKKRLLQNLANQVSRVPKLPDFAAILGLYRGYIEVI